MPHIFKGALNVILILCRPEKTYELIDIKIQTLLEKKGEVKWKCSYFSFTPSYYTILSKIAVGKRTINRCCASNGRLKKVLHDVRC